ncbi:hypothetical protein [Candidatus Mycoplasma mahonii]|uniref:hypothetical protein n=1 Tax=Candidatus Mycoplasma mahonii TaxID=3004105 RepID=UPI0026F36A63|nr:hypothetical protein [Candidatus Mycoplasma mahonii]WKX02321.1 hypothetical protein O3I44_02855 [Candidatus Mycoplasma mahonii]
MKFKDLINIMGTPQKNRYSHREYDIFLNEEEINKMTGVTFKLHSDVYKRVRNFPSPQYDVIYILRNKKAFNTALFKINYDVIVTGKDGIILKIFIDLGPGFISKYFSDGNKIFFCSVGTINNYDIKIKDLMTLRWRFLKNKQ